MTRFLGRQGINGGILHKFSHANAWIFRIAEARSVEATAEKMSPHSFKKREELELLLNYRKRNEITGSQVISRLNSLVQSGKRERHRAPRTAEMPWTYEEGYHLARQLAGWSKAEAHPIVTEAQVLDMRRKHKLFGSTFSELGRMFGVSRGTVRKVILSE